MGIKSSVWSHRRESRTSVQGKGITQKGNTYLVDAITEEVFLGDQLRQDKNIADNKEGIEENAKDILENIEDIADNKKEIDAHVQDLADPHETMPPHLAAKDPHPQYVTPEELPQTLTSWLHADPDPVIPDYLLYKSIKPETGEVPLTASFIGDDQLLFTWIREAAFGEDLNYYQTYTSIVIDILSPAKAVDLYAKLFRREPNGTETEMGTSDTIRVDSTDDRGIRVFTLLISDVFTIVAGDRTVVKLYGSDAGSGGTHSVTVVVEGNGQSRLITYVPIAAFPAPHGGTHIPTGSDPTPGVQPTWVEDETTGDLYPVGAAPDNAAIIGSASNSPAGIAVGGQTLLSAEGVFAQRDDAEGGGVQVTGVRGAGLITGQPNAPVEIKGVAALISTGLYIATSEAVTEEHYLICGQSITSSNGVNYVPILIGPQYFPGQLESATDTQDRLIVTGVGSGGEILIVTLGPLVNSYAAGASQFKFTIRLQEAGGQDVAFAVILKVDGVEAAREAISLNGASQIITDTIILTAPIAAGQTITLHVEGVGTHPNSEGWVRGTLTPSLLEIRQG